MSDGIGLLDQLKICEQHQEHLVKQNDALKAENEFLSRDKGRAEKNLEIINNMSAELTRLEGMISEIQDENMRLKIALRNMLKAEYFQGRLLNCSDIETLDKMHEELILEAFGKLKTF